MNITDTIAAVSTPYGKGGVAMIRISGTEAVGIGEKVFRPASGKKLSDISHSKAVYGEIFMPNENTSGIDDGIAVVFRSPHSFTGEDTVEITCHGGILVTKKVLSAVLAAGARAAEPGEFTRRAYVSGRMKLTEAEALGNLLDAKSESQLTLARNGMKGKLSVKMDELYASLRRVLSGIYAVIDFPDEDLSDMSRGEMIEALSCVLAGIKRLFSTYGTGRAVAEGIPTVICGRTNAGKSSVYNRILGYEAAIVTDVDGTTRDVLKETAVLGKTTLLLCDTAGIRETGDRVESIGIERSFREMERAGLILAVIDGSRSLGGDDAEFAKRIKASAVPSIALINKSDISDRTDISEISDCFDKILHISAASGAGFDELAATIDDMFIDGEINLESDAVVTGARQYASLKNSAEILEKVISDMNGGVSLDACCVGVECAMSALGEADGREIGEEIVTEIFSRFCVGK